jgi:hypothetical protein
VGLVEQTCYTHPFDQSNEARYVVPRVRSRVDIDLGFGVDQSVLAFLGGGTICPFDLNHGFSLAVEFCQVQRACPGAFVLTDVVDSGLRSGDGSVIVF